MFFLHGESESPEAELLPTGRDIPQADARTVTILDFGVDHGRGAHAGNGHLWRTTPVAKVQLDYLKARPVVYARLEGTAGTELLATLAEAVAIKHRRG